MRIIAGKHRGLRLASVGKGDAAAHLRPTADRVRESLFNVLLGGAYGDPLRDARVLDLFAGTGALGLEALSRGAAQATFVENGRTALALIRENLKRTDSGKYATLIRADATRLSENSGAPASLVFMDPPYGKGLGEKALEAARKRGWLAPGALILWEENQPRNQVAGFRTHDQRRYGDTHVTFLTLL